MASSSWLRRFPQARIYILSSILLLSVIIIGFVYIYGQNIESAPLQNAASINQTQVAFYLITMPVISIVHIIGEFLFFIFLCPWSAIIQLIFSIILVLGWLTQAGFWMDCEVMISNDSVPRYCPQSPLKNGGTDRYTGEAIAKNIAIWVAVLLYLVHTFMTAVSFYYARRRKAPDDEQFASFPKDAAIIRKYTGRGQHR